MEQSYPAYRAIEVDAWPRREHFAYYRHQIRCGYSLTVRIDVTKLVRFSQLRKLHFFPGFLYAASRTVNQMDEMRMMLTPEGNPGIWEVSHPNFTIFHEDDKTFSDMWMHYQSDFSSFYQDYLRVMQEYGHRHGMKARDGQPMNFFCVSCVPWLDYTGYFTYTAGNEDPALFPILAFGKYTEQNGILTLPVSLTISHAAADGYHSSLFFHQLQENLNQIGETI